MKMKKVIALALVGLMVAGCLVGCGSKKSGNKAANSTKDIQISYWRSGLGEDWLKNVIEGFEKKYPEYNVEYTASASTPATTAGWGLEETDTVDIYMSGKLSETKWMEPLNDLLEKTADGDTKPLKEKFQASYLEAEVIDGNYYGLTWGGGIIGFVYNKEMFKDAGIKQLPRTTDELVLICDTLNDADITPLCHFISDGYYSFMNNAWWAQYEGMDNWMDFWQNPTEDKMATKDGRYEVMKVHEKLNKESNVLLGSNSDAHVSMQTKFMEGQCAMMLNGSWLASEMSHVGKMDQFEMMKTPVISSITKKLDSVKTEPELRKLITAIDSVTDGTKTEDSYKDGDNYLVEGKSVSAHDWEYVRSARNMTPINYTGTTCHIPNYSNAKDGAKLFLEYMYSDEGYSIYLDTLHIAMPLNLSEGEIKTDEWNSFEKNQAELFGKTETIVPHVLGSQHKLFLDGGADPFCDYLFVGLMGAKNEADRITADEAWEKVETTVRERYEGTWMANIK